ncbi:unnamed protein product [Caretta caretta]
MTQEQRERRAQAKASKVFSYAPGKGAAEGRGQPAGRQHAARRPAGEAGANGAERRGGSRPGTLSEAGQAVCIVAGDQGSPATWPQGRCRQGWEAGGGSAVLAPDAASRPGEAPEASSDRSPGEARGGSGSREDSASQTAAGPQGAARSAHPQPLGGCRSGPSGDRNRQRNEGTVRARGARLGQALRQLRSSSSDTEPPRFRLRPATSRDTPLSQSCRLSPPAFRLPGNRRTQAPSELRARRPRS